jgi:UDP-N-acetylmuramate--alanine ligase
MRQELIGCFADNLGPEDVLIMPIQSIWEARRPIGWNRGDRWRGPGARPQAEHVPERAACGERLAELAQPGDRILIMGARDDTLSQFASDLLARLQ